MAAAHAPRLLLMEYLREERGGERILGEAGRKRLERHLARCKTCQKDAVQLEDIARFAEIAEAAAARLRRKRAPKSTPRPPPVPAFVRPEQQWAEEEIGPHPEDDELSALGNERWRGRGMLSEEENREFVIGDGPPLPDDARARVVAHVSSCLVCHLRLYFQGWMLNAMEAAFFAFRDATMRLASQGRRVPSLPSPVKKGTGLAGAFAKFLADAEVAPFHGGPKGHEERGRILVLQYLFGHLDDAERRAFEEHAAEECAICHGLLARGRKLYPDIARLEKPEDVPLDDQNFREALFFGLLGRPDVAPGPLPS